MSAPAVPDPDQLTEQQRKKIRRQVAPPRPSGAVRLSREERRARGRVAANRKHHPDRPDLIEDDLRELQAAAASRYIRDLVASWPPLTEEQRRRLAVLLAVPDHDGLEAEGAGDG
jgi:hypothetical protein